MTPIAARTSSGSSTTSWPATGPAVVGRIRVERIRIIVVLPAPFGPRSPKIVPSATEISSVEYRRFKGLAHSARDDRGPTRTAHRTTSRGGRRVGRRTRRARFDAPSTPSRGHDLLQQELREGGHLQEHRAPLVGASRSTSRPSRAGLGHLLVLGDVHPHRLRRAQVDTDPVHPFAGRSRPADDVDRLQRLTAPVIALRLA